MGTFGEFFDKEDRKLKETTEAKRRARQQAHEASEAERAKLMRPVTEVACPVLDRAAAELKERKVLLKLGPMATVSPKEPAISFQITCPQRGSSSVYVFIAKADGTVTVERREPGNTYQHSDRRLASYPAGEFDEAAVTDVIKQAIGEALQPKS